MTQILLHPDRLPRYPMGQVFMRAPWAWWETRDGRDVSIERSDNDTEYKVTFGRDGASVILTDPPSVRLLQISVIEDVQLATGLERSMMHSQYVLARVVWHEQPGPGWNQIAGAMTCEPGLYEFNSVASRYGERQRSVDEYNRSLRNMLSDRMALMVWEPIPTIREPQPTQDLIEAVMRAYQQFQVDNRERPAAVLLHPETERQLLMAASNPGAPLMMRDVSGPATLLGIPVNIERSVPPGQVIFIGPETGQIRTENGDLIGIMTSNDIRRIGMLTPNEIRRREGLQEVTDWSGNVIGVLADDPLPEYLERRRARRRSPNILPESEIIAEIDRLVDEGLSREEAEGRAEIDRLVNDQVRGGPVDDYRINRYDKCTQCEHDWHGLECGLDWCDCINTDWLK